MFLQDLADVERIDLNDEYVENMAVLLQSLDTDSGDDIFISQAMHDAFSDENFDLSTISEEDLITVIEENGLVAVTEEDAMEHVKDMLIEDTTLVDGDFEEHIDDSLDVSNILSGIDDDTLVDLDGIDGLEEAENNNEEESTSNNDAENLNVSDLLLDDTDDVLAELPEAENAEETANSETDTDDASEPVLDGVVTLNTIVTVDDFMPLSLLSSSGDDVDY